jgi:hypothetical protein
LIFEWRQGTLSANESGLVCSAHSRTCTHLSLGVSGERAVRDPFGVCCTQSDTYMHIFPVLRTEQIASHRLNRSQKRPWPLNFSWLCAETHYSALHVSVTSQEYSGLYTWNSTAQVHTQRYIFKCTEQSASCSLSGRQTSVILYCTTSAIFKSAGNAYMFHPLSLL